MKPKLKPPGTKRLKLKCDKLLSTSAFKINLRRYNKDVDKDAEREKVVLDRSKPEHAKVGR
jgi:hypothetical protein